MDVHPQGFSLLSTGSAVLILIFLYSFFVLASAVITRSRTSRIRELSEEGYPFTRFARVILTHADSYLLSCQVGAFLSSLFAGVVSYQLIVSSIIPRVSEFLGLSDWIERAVAMGVVFCVVAFLGLACVQTAKALAYARPNRMLCLISLPVVLFANILRPVVWLLRQSLGRALAVIGLRIPVERELAVSAEEISEIVELSSKAGQIEEDEREMIQHVFTFSDTIAREVMTPRKDIVFVEESASLDEVIQVFVNERISRVLVTGSDLDDVKGVLIAKDLLPLVGKNMREVQLKSLVRPAYFVPNSKKVDELLDELRQEGVHFAVVLDEHGGVDGVLTLEDLVEEIVGEIFDEFDSPLEEVDVRRTKSGDLLVDGATIIDDLNATHALSIPKGEYDTLAGFVIHLLGRIPRTGESVRYDDLVFRVEETAQNRVTKIRIAAVAKQPLPSSVPSLAPSSVQAAPGAPTTDKTGDSKKTLSTANAVQSAGYRQTARIQGNH